MATPELVDLRGNPLFRKIMTERTAGATMAGVRQPVMTGASRGLTPSRLATMLREAEDNNPERYMELAEEMEEKDLHYVAILGTRKRQVSQLPISVQAASKDQPDQVASQMVQEDLIDSGVIDRYLFDMLDAVGKGFSLGEIVWDLSAGRWKPVALEQVDPRFVRFDWDTRRIPLLLGSGGEFQPLPPYKFLFCQIKAKSGIPVRGGLARNAAWAYLFKNYGLKDWVQFAEIYGLPLRVGKYPPGASDDDKEALLQAVSAIAIDAAGIIPANMIIDFVETAAKGATADLYKLLLQYLDDQLSKAVLGQTGTTDATPGKLGANNEHDHVRSDIERADAMEITAALNEQLVRPYLDLNLGPRPRYPWLKIGRADVKDAAQMTDTAQKLVPLGLKVRASDIYDAVGFTEPQDGDTLLTPPAAPLFPGLPGPGTPGGPQLHAALPRLLAAEMQGGRDVIQQAADEQLADWRDVTQPMVDQILALAKSAKGTNDAELFANFRKGLAALYPQVDSNALAQRLALMTFQAFAGGATGDRIE